MAEPLSLDDLIGMDSLLTEEERLIRGTIRRFVHERYLPRAAELFEELVVSHPKIQSSSWRVSR